MWDSIISSVKKKQVKESAMKYCCCMKPWNIESFHLTGCAHLNPKHRLEMTRWSSLNQYPVCDFQDFIFIFFYLNVIFFSSSFFIYHFLIFFHCIAFTGVLFNLRSKSERWIPFCYSTSLPNTTSRYSYRHLKEILVSGLSKLVRSIYHFHYYANCMTYRPIS